MKPASTVYQSPRIRTVYAELPRTTSAKAHSKYKATKQTQARPLDKQVKKEQGGARERRWQCKGTARERKFDKQEKQESKTATKKKSK